MSNLETFESKKRQLSAKKDSTRAKMFNRSPVRAWPDPKNKTEESKQRSTERVGIRPLVNQVRNQITSPTRQETSSNEMSEEEVMSGRRMTSPPGKQQLQGS